MESLEHILQLLIKVSSETTMKTGYQLFSILQSQLIEKMRSGLNAVSLVCMMDTEVILVQNSSEINYTTLSSNKIASQTILKKQLYVDSRWQKKSSWQCVKVGMRMVPKLWLTEADLALLSFWSLVKCVTVLTLETRGLLYQLMEDKWLCP